VTLQRVFTSIRTHNKTGVDDPSVGQTRHLLGQMVETSPHSSATPTLFMIQAWFTVR